MILHQRYLAACAPTPSYPEVGATRDAALPTGFFGVLPDQRGRGLGRRLWRGAMHWGHTSGAAYQLLQTELDGASDRLCQAEGLGDLAFVLTATAEG